MILVEKKTSIVPTPVGFRLKYLKKHTLAIKKNFKLRLCDFFSSLLFIRSIFGVYTVHRNYTRTKWTNAHCYRILSSIENICFENKEKKKSFSLFTLEFVENEARRNKMFVSVWVGNAVVAHEMTFAFSCSCVPSKYTEEN